MANTFTLKSQSYQGRYLELTCSQTTDIATNTSTIYWTLTSTGGTSNYYSTGPTTVLINGEKVYYTARVAHTTKKFPAAKGSTNGTLEVKHNDNGSKTIAVSLSTDIYHGRTPQTVSGNWELDTIPRAATITRVSTFTDTTNPVIYYSNPLGDKAILNAYIYPQGNSSTPLAGPFPISATASSATLTLTDAQKTALYGVVPSGTNNVKVSFKIKTTYMLSSYWSNDYTHTFTIVPGGPKLSPPHIEDVDSTTQYLGNATAVIKGHSDIHIQFEAIPQKEASIISYQVSNNGVVKAGNDVVFENVENSIFICSATDSHGFTTSMRAEYEMIDYVNLTCHQEAGIELVGETGAKITLTISGNYYNGDFPAEPNFLDLYYRITDDNGEWLEWTYIGDIQPTFGDDNTYSLTLPITGLSYDKTYKVQSKASDWLIRNIETPDLTLSLIPVFDWSNTDFNFNVPVKFQGQEMADMVVERGITSSGWAYRKWQSGAAECWRRLQITTGVSNAWGGLYTSGSLSSTNLSYPFSFTETPILSVSLMPFGSGGLIMATGNGYGSGTQTGPFEIARGTSLSSGQFLLAYHAYGKWK